MIRHRLRPVNAACALLFLIVLTGTSVLAPDGFAPGQVAAADDLVFDYVILVDVSGSMVGLPDGSGNAVIFPDVKQAIGDFLRGVAKGSQLRIVPFSGQIDSAKIASFTIRSSSDRRAAIAQVDGLEATGEVTWLYRAIDTGLNQLAEMRGSDEKAHIQTLMIWSDGQGNGPDDLALGSLLDRIDAARSTDQNYLYVKYISLGVSVTDKETLEEHGVEVIEEAGAVHSYQEVRVEPLAINLGRLEAGGVGKVEFAFSSPPSAIRGKTVQLSLAGELPEGVELRLDPAEVTIATDSVPLAFQLVARSTVPPPGTYRVNLLLNSNDPYLWFVPQMISVTFVVSEPTVTPTLTASATVILAPSPSPSPTPTATLSPTATATLTPEPTETQTTPPTETPSPTVTPSPTATATAVIEVPSSVDLGTVKLDVTKQQQSMIALAVPVPITVSNSGERINLEVTADAGGAIPLQVPDNLFLEAVEGLPVEQLTFASGSDTVTVGMELDPAPLYARGEDTYHFAGRLIVRRGAADLASMATDGALGDTSATVIPIRFAVKLYRPFDPTPLIVLSGLAGLLALLGWSFPRFPRSAALIGAYHETDVRAAQRRRFAGWLRGGPVDIGGSDSTVDLGLTRPAARLTGRWGWPKQVVLTPQHDGVVVNDEPLPEGSRYQLRDGDALQIDGVAMTFRGANRPAEYDLGSSDEIDGGAAPPVRRGGLRRRRRSEVSDDTAFDWNADWT